MVTDAEWAERLDRAAAERRRQRDRASEIASHVNSTRTGQDAHRGQVWCPRCVGYVARPHVHLREVAS